MSELTVSSIRSALLGIDEKVQFTLERLDSLVDKIEYPACAGHSGGKDSVVNQWLLSKSIITQLNEVDIIHTSKPGGDNAIHPDTLEFLYQRPFPITYWPRALGNNPKYKTQFDGSRRSEYTRLDRSANFVRNGLHVSRVDMNLIEPNSMFGMTFVFPFFDWSDSDVWACIYKNHLPFSLEYVEETKLLSLI